MISVTMKIVVMVMVKMAMITMVMIITIIMIITMMTMTRRMVRMLLFDSLIAVGLPGDGNKQLLATITTDP